MLYNVWNVFRRWDWGVAAITLVLLCLAFVAYRTSAGYEDPIIDDQGYAIAYRNKESTTIEYDRTFRVMRAFDGTVYRSIECDRNQRSFDVVPVIRQFTKGTQSTSRAFAVEIKYLVNSECKLRTWVEYHPMGSLRPHIYEVRPISFKILGDKDAEGCKSDGKHF
jgi:hypothetical protein